MAKPFERCGLRRGLRRESQPVFDDPEAFPGPVEVGIENTINRFHRLGARVRRSTSAHLVHEPRGGTVADHRYQDDLSAGLFDNLPADNDLRCVIIPLDEDVGPQGGDETGRCLFPKDDHVINWFEGGEQFGAFPLGDERSAGSFQFFNGSVGVESDDEDITESFCLPQYPQMADVQKVETTVGENNFFSGAFEPGDDFPEAGTGDDLHVVRRGLFRRVRRPCG